MSIIVSNCQHCDEQQFRTLSCVHCTTFSVVESDLFMRALLLDRILVIEKNTRTRDVRVHLVKEILLVVVNLCNLQFSANIVVHTVLTDLPTRFC